MDFPLGLLLTLSQLVESNGMEVFPKYFRRLLTGNAPQIFPGVNKSVENAGNYPLLVQEMQQVTQDPEQARRIAETVDMSEGDIFRDFDLSTFLDHFKLDPLTKVAVALAFKMATKSDLRAKGKSLVGMSELSVSNRGFFSRCNYFKLHYSFPTVSRHAVRSDQEL